MIDYGDNCLFVPVGCCGCDAGLSVLIRDFSRIARNRKYVEREMFRQIALDGWHIVGRSVACPACVDKRRTTTTVGGV